MNFLLIGGTKFLGRALVEAAIARGHRLTLLHRGQTNPGLYPDVEHLLCDRNTDLSVLRGRKWDAVVDTSAYFPRQVRSLLDLSNENRAIKHYTFISTISVYRDTHQPGIDESYPVGAIQDQSTETINNDTYGPLKALCERAAEQCLPGRVLTIRPGLIVGPHDPTDRFTYWPVRIQRGGAVLAPGRPERPIQFIDVRDLSEWTIRMIETGTIGVFNADSVPGEITMEALLLACKQVAGASARLHWLDDEFLLRQSVGMWIEMPLWVPETEPDAAGFFSVSVEKAVAAGLTYRRMTDTIRATLDWANARPADYKWQAGLAPERERELLELSR